jgi:serine/threonine protein kinase
MTAPATVDDFLAIVMKSGVVDPGRIDSHLQPLRAIGKLPESPNALGDLLVSDGLLTRFHVQNFLQGKYLGFTLGNYKIIDLLGSGGMSAVYLCEDKQRRCFAVKVLPRSLAKDPIILKRFYREARASAALDHPNIVRGHDVGQEKQQHFFIMEYVDGISLQELVANKGPLPIADAANYVRQAAIGLQHAYQAGLIHRDIKPGNLLLDRNGTIKILDMGLSRFYNDEDSVLTKDVVGTLDYLAPEQARDSHSVDIRADIYSLGGTFYYLLTGRSPLVADTHDPRAIAQQTCKPPAIDELRPEVPAALVAVVDRMMALDPNQRYSIPAAVVKGLAPWSSDEMALAAGHDRPRDRRIALPCALIGAGLLLAIGLGFLWWTLLRT